MAQYSIKDLEKVTGIKAHTIRIWEKRYGIVQPSRSDTNIRSYTDEDLRKLLNISLLNRQGIKISKLAKMAKSDIEEQVRDLAQKSEDSDSKIEALLMAMIDIDEERFYKSLDLSIRAHGFENAFTRIIFPFLHKAGVLWMAGTINPAQEHFVSNLVRQKMIAEIDRLDRVTQPGASRFLLFLPEGELHELGLLYIYYFLQKMGQDCIYFGQTTPLESVKRVALQWKPDHIVFSIVNSMALKKPGNFLQEVRQSFPEKKIWVNGFQTQFLRQEELHGMKIIRDYQMLGELLEK